ncbi:MAG TPA: DUF4367 domain-containing protein [Bacilli bacterium]|nr:DUF4367 domain-containing protein [Bacilli bacterium]
MKKVYLVLITVLVLSLALFGCGTRDQETVMKDLAQVQKDLTSYQSQATMTVTANNTTQKYSIETWYKAPNFYRIALGNQQKEITQVIVRNEEGIFVVSPQLKKSFRFKGDWAENQGHVYLYHAVLDRILKAKETDFDTAEGKYIFTLNMEPENPLVAKQQITLADSNYAPKQVALLDKNKNAVVSVDYESFKTGVEFKDDAFTPEAAMTLAPEDATPVMAGAKDFGIIEPRYVPSGVKLAEPRETKNSILLQFQGDTPFSIIEERPAAKVASLSEGELVDLWGNTGVITGQAGDYRSLHWIHNGVEFSLTGKMAVDEMVKIAQSMIGGGK